MSTRQVVSRINVELGRENNGIGEYFDTCTQLRDGLIDLDKLKGTSRASKIRELRGLVEQLPQIAP